MSQISEEERSTNVMAATMGQQNRTVAHFDIHESTFEQCFNSVCYYLAITDGVKTERTESVVHHSSLHKHVVTFVKSNFQQIPRDNSNSAVSFYPTSRS